MTKELTKIYVVVFVDTDHHYEVSYHRTRKGAHKEIMMRKREAWEHYRYIAPGSYEDYYFTIREKELND